MKPKVVVDGMEMSDAFRQHFATVFERAEVVMVSPEREPLLAAMPGAAVLANKAAAVDADVMDAAGGTLKAVCIFGIGFDRIDLAAATRRGVAVVNAPVFASSMAEANLALMLAVTHKLMAKVQRAQAGLGRNDSLRGHTLEGHTLGLIGFGRIARETAKRAMAFGMRIIAHDPYLSDERILAAGAAPSALADLLAQSDFVSLNCNLTDENRHMISTAELSAMKPTAVLINAARGPLVDEAALTAALMEGRLAGAGLDVLEHEPPAKDNPLLHLPGVVVTPHCLGATWEGITQVIDAVQDSTLRALSGEQPQWIVNREVLNG